MLTELDLSIRELAAIYAEHKWFPATEDWGDLEDKIRDALRSLLAEIVKYPEKQDGVAGTMRLFIEKDAHCNMAQVYLQIGSVEW